MLYAGKKCIFFDTTFPKGVGGRAECQPLNRQKLSNVAIIRQLRQNCHDSAAVGAVGQRRGGDAGGVFLAIRPCQSSVLPERIRVRVQEFRGRIRARASASLGQGGRDPAAPGGGGGEPVFDGDGGAEGVQTHPAETEIGREGRAVERGR